MSSPWYRRNTLPYQLSDSLAAFEQVQACREAAIAGTDQQTALSRDSTSGPSLDLASYAGTCTDRWYGNMTIASNNEGLLMQFEHTPSLVGDLQHWQYDTFIVRWSDRQLRAYAFVMFALNPDGSIDHIKMKAVSPATDFSFDFQDLVFVPAVR